MTVKDFLKTVFGKCIGSVDAKLPVISLPELKFIEYVNECDLECGTNPNTCYALDTFELCPRAYMIKYLAKHPLSIPFYAQVQEVVRETLYEYAKGFLPQGGVQAYFEERFGKIVVGPFPIHHPNMDWVKDYRESIGRRVATLASQWEREGWQIEDAYRPVALNLGDREIVGCIDLVLRNASGDLALVAYDINDVYVRGDGVIAQEEDKNVIRRLTRRLYLYGSSYEAAYPEKKGKIKKLMLTFYHPPNDRDVFSLEFDWQEPERKAAIDWADSVSRQIEAATQDKRWPAVIVTRLNRDGIQKEDNDFCWRRCPHCLSCRWAGWHPEEIAEFVHAEDIVRIPQKYVSVRLTLKPGLDRQRKIRDIEDRVELESGGVKGITFVQRSLELINVQTIGDLEGKTIYDFAAIPGCGLKKIETIIAFFYDVERNSLKGDMSASCVDQPLQVHKAC